MQSFWFGFLACDCLNMHEYSLAYPEMAFAEQEKIEMLISKTKKTIGFLFILFVVVVVSLINQQNDYFL